MPDKMIKSSVVKKRNPAIAFILSLLFTGAGELYTGELYRGLVMLASRVIPLLIIPVVISMKYSDSYIVSISVLFATSTLFFLASPFHAMIRAIKSKEYKLKKSNNVLLYIIYITISFLIISAATVFTEEFFSFKPVMDDRAYPALSKGDIILTLKYMPHGYRKGDLVFLKGDNSARIICVNGESCSISRDNVLVNGYPLSRAVLSEDDIKKYGIKFTDSVIYEINGGRKYPVVSSSELLGKSGFSSANIKAGRFLTGADNRGVKNPFIEVSDKDISARIEGIIFSKNINKILMKPHTQ